MKRVLQILFLLLVVSVVAFFLYQRSQDDGSVINPDNLKRKVPVAAEDYELIPRDELLHDTAVARDMWKVLKTRYAEHFKDLIGRMKEAGVKPLYCWMTTEVGVSETPLQAASKPFIRALCRQYEIPFVDFSDLFIGREPTEITHMPKDGHLNEQGALLVAERMAKIIQRYQNHRATAHYPDSDRPRLMGELDPDQDRVATGGVGIPYRLITNSAGLRMKREVRFDSTGQRILLMGDSGFYFPFIDNAETPRALLQKQFPQKEVLNVSNWGYTLTDYKWQWNERAKYLEPDLVLLQSSGDDIADLYFTHQRRFSRARGQKSFRPAPVEKAFYEYLENLEK